MARVLLLGPAREAAGTGRDDVEGDTLASVLDEAARRYGEEFRSILAVSQVWVNGQPASPLTPLAPYDEVAVLPPVSGG